MATPNSPDSTRIRGFAKGTNNIAPEQDMPVDEFGKPVSAREAVNVDFVGPRKTVRKREGYAKLGTGRFHSPHSFGGELLAVQDGDLRAFTGAALEQSAVVRAGVGERHLTYADAHGDLYWSNGLEFRCIRGGVDGPGWVDAPGVPRVDAAPAGGMAAGEYGVAMTWLDASGRESGALGIGVTTVAAGGGIAVSAIPAPPESATHFRVYVSAPDGDELYAAGDYVASVSQTSLGADAGQGGRALETLWHQPLPPCDILRFWNGRLLGAAGNVFLWSAPMRFGLMPQDAYMRVGQEITLLEPVGHGDNSAGVWLADHASVYWMEGSTPDQWRRVIKAKHAAVPGTSLQVTAADIGLEGEDRVAVWLSTAGEFIAGLPGGKLLNLTGPHLALPAGERGASVLRSGNGLKQLVTSYLAGPANALAVGDRASASVTRHSPL